ncbi:hydroxylysine kinase [Erpetoichthys calabaricus]|uniref:Hydroxylysine kinase n=1 Tax=Erpetoichthys calabaricus TaxID=27687 RepID=A0A8C4S404_ERPCA|nr:hydroxylysine kinase [Erpetoichthys calabaricus]XP_028650773.1 hydroxylysine kinase [Erpetoichthys calabaricus]XP_051778016.1 hydroxylysine kinase [Erpetoichthys calabaricus]XP_051778017.1 hydroxylysine kinase [Erpetoichthys calabaricus]
MSRVVNCPYSSDAQVVELVKRVYGLVPSKVNSLPSYLDQNFHLEIAGLGDFVLKIINYLEGRNPEVLEGMLSAMMKLNETGLPIPVPQNSLDGKRVSVESIEYSSNSHQHMVVMLTYLQGTPIAKTKSSPQLLYEIGRMAARVDSVLTELDSSCVKALHRNNFIWNLTNVPLLEQYLCHIKDNTLREVVAAVIQQFKEKIEPNLPDFRKCVNHGDLNDHNILVMPEEDGLDKPVYKISGILDFGDMSYGFYVFEVAIVIMYMMIESPEPLNVGSPVLAGYESMIPLNAAERDALYLLVLCRFCQSLVMANYNVVLHPENEEYLMITARMGWRLLLQLWKMGKEAVEELWFRPHKADI